MFTHGVDMKNWLARWAFYERIRTNRGILLHLGRFFGKCVQALRSRKGVSEMTKERREKLGEKIERVHQAGESHEREKWNERTASVANKESLSAVADLIAYVESLIEPPADDVPKSINDPTTKAKLESLMLDLGIAYLRDADRDGHETEVDWIPARNALLCYIEGLIVPPDAKSPKDDTLGREGR